MPLIRRKRRDAPTPTQYWEYTLLQWPNMRELWPVVSNLPIWQGCEDLDEGITQIHLASSSPADFLIARPQRERPTRHTPMDYEFWLVDLKGRVLFGGSRTRGAKLGPLLTELQKLFRGNQLGPQIRVIRLSMGQWAYFHLDILENNQGQLNGYFARMTEVAQRR